LGSPNWKDADQNKEIFLELWTAANHEKSWINPRKLNPCWHWFGAGDSD